MRWYIADPAYIADLQSIDDKVQNITYSRRVKPYLGIVLSIGKYRYYVPVSSPKPKHEAMREDIDFFKFTNRNGKLLCILNLNNMLPIPDAYITALAYSDIEGYVAFASDSEKTKYINLLRDELDAINKKSLQILASAAELRGRCIANPNGNLARRSCDFAKLERYVDQMPTA
ncbi:MAG: type III toxin-antitoxin system ToxN/AbiQ family toxin [Clostridia bacterium]